MKVFKQWGLGGRTGHPTLCYNDANQVTLKSHRSHSESHNETQVGGSGESWHMSYWQLA